MKWDCQCILFQYKGLALIVSEYDLFWISKDEENRRSTKYRPTRAIKNLKPTLSDCPQDFDRCYALDLCQLFTFEQTSAGLPGNRANASRSRYSAVWDSFATALPS